MEVILQKPLEFFGLFLYLAGLIIGLGAIVVIEFHGLLGRKSPYWTLATTRAHKITKPLIWLGFFMAIIGGILFYQDKPLNWIITFQIWLIVPMFLNGLFLTFVVSTFLLKQEKQGHADQLLPDSLQTKITLSFIISTLTWWGQVFLLVLYLLK